MKKLWVAEYLKLGVWEPIPSIASPIHKDVTKKILTQQLKEGILRKDLKYKVSEYRRHK